MFLTHDVYSEMNPAYCTFTLGAFVSSFVSIKAEGPELVTVYVSLPIALSGELERSFEGTNRNTGLMDWLGRSPQIRIGLTARLNGSLEIVTEAVRLACFSKALVLTPQGRLHLGSRKLKRLSREHLNLPSRNAFRRAERLGYWFAAAGSSRTMFEAMGLTL